jgi:hypothetical protein
MEYTKDFLKETLENMLAKMTEEIDAGDADPFDWYYGLFPDGMSNQEGYFIQDKFGEYGDDSERYSAENVLAIEAMKFPELHSLMVELLEKIIEFNEDEGVMWESDEEQAGNSLIRELCKADAKYLPLYFRFIKTNDLDHEVYQSLDMAEVCNGTGCPPEIMPVLLYRSEHGQEAEVYAEFADGICKTKEEAQKYLDQAGVYFDDQWSFETAESVDEDDCRRLCDMFEPVFKELFELDDEQMSKFAMEYNNIMAEGEKPTIEQLLAATK